MSSTNYFNTLIEVAEDCKSQVGTPPPTRGKTKSIANYEYEMLSNSPYVYTSDDVMFGVFAARKGIPDSDLAEQRSIFFSKGRPCFRASPLTKSYGWGVHSNDEGKVAIYGVETDEYKDLANNKDTITKKAMRSKKA